MSINSTLLYGFQTQLYSMVEKIKTMEGYNKEDYNPYLEMVGNLESAAENIFYILKDLSDKSN